MSNTLNGVDAFGNTLYVCLWVHPRFIGWSPQSDAPRGRRKSKGANGGLIAPNKPSFVCCHVRQQKYFQSFYKVLDDSFHALCSLDCVQTL